VIVVEVASPSTRLGDVNDKVEFYERIASMRHYLVIGQDHRRIIHSGRGAAGRLEPAIFRQGSIGLEPPGLELDMAALYRETALGDG
jgi:Uma2 family endonuclease